MPKDDRARSGDRIPSSRKPEQVIKAIVVPKSYSPSVLVPSLEHPIADAHPCIPDKGTPEGHLELVQGEE